MLTSKDKIFRYIVYGLGRKHEDEYLTSWALLVRWLFYPLESIYWHIHHKGKNRYEPRTGIWHIRGMQFSYDFFDTLHNAKGEVFTVYNNDNDIVFEQIKYRQHHRLKLLPESNPNDSKLPEGEYLTLNNGAVHRHLRHLEKLANDKNPFWYEFDDTDTQRAYDCANTHLHLLQDKYYNKLWDDADRKGLI